MTDRQRCRRGAGKGGSGTPLRREGLGSGDQQRKPGPFCGVGGIGELCIRGRQVRNGGVAVDQRLDAAELDQRLDAVATRRRLLERTAQEGDRTVRRAAAGRRLGGRTQDTDGPCRAPGGRGQQIIGHPVDR